MNDFVKKNDVLFLAQFTTFKTKIPNYVSLFGITPAKLVSINDDYDWLNYVITRNNGVPGFAQDWTKFKNQVRHGGDGSIIPPFPLAPDVSTPPASIIEPDIEGRFRQFVGELKANINWSKTIGEDLQVEAPVTDFDAENYKPEGSVKAVLNIVTVKFSKKGVDGQSIYSRVTPGVVALPTEPGTPITPAKAELNQFSKIATDYHSPYIDNRELAVPGQPELREYFLVGVKNDEEIGVPSDYLRVIAYAS